MNQAAIAAAAAISEQLDGGYNHHWCAEWAAADGCTRCREIAAEALKAVSEVERAGGDESA